MNASRSRCTGTIRFIWEWIQNEHLIDNGSSARDVPEQFFSLCAGYRPRGVSFLLARGDKAFLQYRKSLSTDVFMPVVGQQQFGQKTTDWTEYRTD